MVDQTMSKFGKIDVLVNNTGIGPLPKPLVERFNVQGSGLMSPNRLKPKDLLLPIGGK